MVFLYSRKIQLVLLLCWLAGMMFILYEATGDKPEWLAELSEQTPPPPQKARIGAMPDALATIPPPVKEDSPPPPARPEADPHFNRCLALRQLAGPEGGGTLILELDYVAAQSKGFSLEKAHSYYLEDSPVFVIALGDPWISDIGNAAVPVNMRQVSGVSLIVSKSHNLRLLVQVPSMHAAQRTKARITPTDTGLRAEIDIPD